MTREQLGDATSLRLHLFGHLTAKDASGKTVLPRTRKARAVLAVLALANPKPVLRLQLTSLLWSQRDTVQARGSLRQALHDLHDSLGPLGTRFLIAERHHLTLKGDGLWIDLQDLAQPDQTSAERLAQFSFPLVEDLVGLDPAFDHWLEDTRGRIVRQGISIGERMLLAQQDSTKIQDTAKHLLALDETHEGAWRAVIRAQIAQGDASAALSSYERCRVILAQTRNTEPSQETEELVARARAALNSRGSAGPVAPPSKETSAPAESAAPRHNATSGIRIGITPLRLIGTAGHEELAIGLAEEITTALARFRWISCVSATSWAALAGETVMDGLWKRLDLDFVLDGTIQKAGELLRITVRLMDMRQGGSVIWARRFDREVSDTLAIQDEIGAAIVAQLDPVLLIHEGERAAARQVTDPSAHELVLQSVPAIYRLEQGGFHAAGALLEEAVSAAPGNAIAHAWYAYWHLFLVGQGWTRQPAEAAVRASGLAERAVMLDPGDARSLTLAGHVRGFLGKRALEASSLHDRALALNPNLAIAWCFSGLAHSYMGKHDEALRRMYQAVRLSPSDPHLFFFNMALIMPHLLLGESQNATEVGRTAIELNPWFSSSYKGHLAALGFLDRSVEAKDVMDRLLELEPGFSVQEAAARSPISQPPDLARYTEGLRRAGLPEYGPPGSIYAAQPQLDGLSL